MANEIIMDSSVPMKALILFEQDFLLARQYDISDCLC